MVFAGGTLFAGGAFWSVDLQPHIGLAAYSIQTVDVQQRLTAGLRLSMSPSPFSESARLAYALPSADVVTIRMYDVTGRLVSTLVDHELRSAGPHAETFDGQNLRAGVYLCRIEAGSQRANLKVVRTR
jgi:hypothetical protein